MNIKYNKNRYAIQNLNGLYLYYFNKYDYSFFRFYNYYFLKYVILE